MDNFFQNSFKTFFGRNPPVIWKFPDGMFGRKDNDQDPFNFSSGERIFEQLNRHMNSMQERLWSQLGGEHFQQGGEVTVTRTGPGYHVERHYNVQPNGLLSEVKQDITSDALEHKNPLDTGMHNDDIEFLVPEKEEGLPMRKSETLDTENKKTEDKNKFYEANFLLPLINEVIEDRNEVEMDRVGLYQKGSDIVEKEDRSCGGKNKGWSDWLACLHARVGLPRWLTAATISLGVVFSIWLCLVIPSAAPKQRLRAAVDAKAKEANSKAKEASISGKLEEAGVVVVDLPPPYTVPPPPPYTEVAGVDLEPVHQPTQTEKKDNESEA